MNRAAEIISTVFYIGYIPYAPGTFGSLAALCICALTGFYFLSYWNLICIILSILFFLTGLFASSHITTITKEQDPSYIVIDELSGQALVFALVPFKLTNLILGFLLFRFFDIYKPWPINRSQKLISGWGIMVDDVIAGAYSAIILLLINKTYEIKI
ncbi:MAG: phosphatidylglycerophosphatase A [Spirochaetia bacterium]|nr:phosphatidylglycerophosphatase A [Spirochaetia bacterium]